MSVLAASPPLERGGTEIRDFSVFPSMRGRTDTRNRLSVVTLVWRCRGLMARGCDNDVLASLPRGQNLLKGGCAAGVRIPALMDGE